MNVKKIEGIESIPVPSGHQFTEEQLQNEYAYFWSERIMRRLLSEGLISEGEFNKIVQENRKTFSPFLGEILA